MQSVSAAGWHQLKRSGRPSSPPRRGSKARPSHNSHFPLRPIYCFAGGTTGGASPGGYDKLGTDGSYSNCNDIGRTGFDCRGLTLYAVYQGTGGAVSLPTSTAGAQYSGASTYGGSYISLNSVEPGDLVFFGSSSSSIDHVGIVVSGSGTSANIISAVSEKYGITTKTVSWFQAQFGWVGAVAIPNVGSTVGGGGGGGGGAPIPTAVTIAARGLDNTIWYVQPGVQGWQTTGQAFFAAGTPSIAALPNGNVVIAARGEYSPNSIWYTIPGQQGWTSTGQAYIATSDPAVGVSSNGTITIAPRGLDNTIWDVQPGVQGWQTTGNGFFASGNPSIGELPNGNVVIAARGANENNIWYTIPGQQGWTSTGQAYIATSDPAVGVSSTGTITIAARGLDNTIWDVQPGVQGWQTTGNGFFASGNPSIGELPNGNVVIAARGANQNNIWYTIPGQQGWTSTGQAYIATSDPAVG